LSTWRRRGTKRGSFGTDLIPEVIAPIETKGHRMPETPTTYKPFIDKLADGQQLPKGFDTWGLKVVRGDLTTYLLPGGQRFQWPHPSQGRPAVVEDPSASGTASCPSPSVGGFAVAKNLQGAAAGGYGHGPVLLVAYNSGDVLAQDSGKVRTGLVAVVKVFHSDVYKDCAGFDLHGADLRGLRLPDANFAGANLRGARLNGAHLERAHFEGADCSSANFSRANLTGADFSGAKLRSTKGNNVIARDARFGLADFTGAEWTGTDFAHAAFDGADMGQANFHRANLTGVVGQPKHVGTMVLSSVVLGSTGSTRTRPQAHPFKAISVPAGRNDILAALTGAGVLATMEKPSS